MVTQRPLEPYFLVRVQVGEPLDALRLLVVCDHSTVSSEVRRVALSKRSASKVPVDPEFCFACRFDRAQGPEPVEGLVVCDHSTVSSEVRRVALNKRSASKVPIISWF